MKDSPYNRRGIRTGGGGLPATPTDTTPGSAERLAVLAARAEAGVSLHHPADARLESGATFRDGPRVFRVAAMG